MTRDETLRAAEILAASPAARWIGNKLAVADDLAGAILIQKCTRCGAEQVLKMPSDAVKAFQGGQRGDDLASLVPPGFDEELYAWKRGFQLAHEGCTEHAA